MNENSFRLMPDNRMIPGAVVEKDGVHFGFYAPGVQQPWLLLYRKGTEEIVARLPFPDDDSCCLHTMKVKLRPSQYEYNYMVEDQVITDPYAFKIAGRETYGAKPSDSPHSLRGGFTDRPYDWGDDRLPSLAYSEAVMYHLHVRGFTKQKNSGVRKKGTFAGLREKIPYLKSLGINQVRLMPVYEFEEITSVSPGQVGVPRSQDEARMRMMEQLPGEQHYKRNFWGYGPGYYFALKSSYAYGPRPEEEFKDLVKALHAEGIEIILEFQFTDQADVGLITSCLYYWAMEYHVDGFALMARDSLTPEIARLPLFRTRKLICTWYPDSVIHSGAGEESHLLADCNDGFMNDCRRMLKGDAEFLSAFGYRLRKNAPGCPGINYMTNHDGFTLMDLVSYDRKHNAENMEQDRDGTDYNYSWNCGEEGPSRKRETLRLRMRQRKNAFAMMLLSQGVPMLLAGDEFGNSQNGNNNPYCHDSELTWVDWSRSRSERELTQFVCELIAYRKSHKVFHQDEELLCSDRRASGYPDLSYHGSQAWYGDFDHANRHIGCLYSCQYAGEKGFIYVAWNFDWQEQQFALPVNLTGGGWYKVMDTSQKDSFVPEDRQERLADVKSFAVPARTVVILEGREHDAAGI